MQVAADGADQVLVADLGLLLDERVAERVVEDVELYDVVGQVLAKVRVVGVLGEERRLLLEYLVDVERRGRIGQRGDCHVQARLVTLERTHVQAFGEQGRRVVLEESEKALGLRGRQAKVVIGQLMAEIARRAVARERRQVGQAEDDACVARVRVVGVDDLLEVDGVGEERTYELAVLVHSALAVGVRPLVVLQGERASDGNRQAVAGRDHYGQRQARERIVRAVLDKQIKALLFCVFHTN